MQLRSDALTSALRKSIPRCLWVHGDEPLQVQEACDTFRRHLRANGFDERQVFHVDRYFRPETLIGQTSTMSLFGGRQLFELRFTGKPGKESLGFLGGVLTSLSDDHRVLVMSPRLERGTQDTAWFAAIDAHAWVLPIYPIERAQLPRWLAQRLAAQGQRAEPATLEWIAERVEGNLLAAHQEIGKLGLLFAEGALPDDEVRAAVMNVARYDAFDLTSAMLTGDVSRALRSLDGLRAEGEAEPLVLWAIGDACRTLLRLALAVRAGEPLPQAMRAARVFGPRDRLYTEALRRLHTEDSARSSNHATTRASTRESTRASLRTETLASARSTPPATPRATRGTAADPVARLERALQQAARIDRMVKGLDSGDPWHALATLVSSIAGAPALLAPEL